MRAALVAIAAMTLASVAVVKGLSVVSTATFMGAGTAFIGNEVPTQAANILACGAKCALSMACGAFTWDTGANPNCILLLEVTNSDESQPHRVSYRGMNLANNDQLFRVPSNPTAKWGENVQSCKSMSFDLMPFPSALRDTVVVASQGKASIDMKTHVGSLDLFDHSGTPLDTSLRRAQDSMPSITSVEHCFVSDHFGAYAINCADWATGSMMTVCVVKVG